jgi:hypothetical protein
MIDVLELLRYYLNSDIVNHILKYVNFDAMFTRMAIPKIPFISIGRLLNSSLSAIYPGLGEYLRYRTGFECPNYTTIWVLHRPRSDYNDVADYEIYIPKYKVSVTHKRVFRKANWDQDAYEARSLGSPFVHSCGIWVDTLDIHQDEIPKKERFFAFKRPDELKRYDDYHIQMRSPLAKDLLDFIFRMKGFIPVAYINRRLQHIRWVPT